LIGRIERKSFTQVSGFENIFLCGQGNMGDYEAWAKAAPAQRSQSTNQN
jgi:hypothetical protein